MNKAQKQVQQVQLDSEQKTIRQLQRVYEQAKKDTERKISELSSRTDLENLQSIIYQKQYQEAIKKQLEGVLDDLQGKQFTTVADYLQESYHNGYVGVMYDLTKQGIPVIMPINQEQVVKALQTDSKISQGLYSRMGEDVQYLKRSIRAELSRGIAQGSSWNEIAGRIANGMNSPYRKALNRTILIARTEGHRIQQQSALDAQYRAKEKGADVVKQWDSTLDNRTRPHHRRLDGQIRELDEPFEVDGLKAAAPGQFGRASEDCNCRCCLLQRARWALDEDELNELKERAAFFGLDKSEDFDDFKKKYLKLPDNADTMKVEKDGFIYYQQAKSIKEAEKFVKETCGIQNCSYKGISLDVANEMNKSLINALNYCPDLKGRVNFYGSAQERNKLFKKELEEYWYTELSKKYSGIFSEKELRKHAKSFASKTVGKVPKNCYAFASSGKVSGEDEAYQAICKKYAGICVNNQFGSDYELFRSSVERDTKIQWHPVGTGTVEAVFDHEFGHQLDYAYDLRNDKTILELFSSMSKAEIKKELSEYGAANVAEFIAEGYSEYLNNETPRHIAEVIGGIIEKAVNKK